MIFIKVNIFLQVQLEIHHNDLASVESYEVLHTNLYKGK